VIKRRDLARHLLAHGCVTVRQGRRHEVWTDAAGDRRTTVPRHGELPLGTARAICRQLGIPPV
jgi:predicted RNA binding protein YcfA (HicA-like mRNA interferase family)